MGRRRRGRDLSGWLVIDKPAGPTSADVVSRVLRLLAARKGGHGGTLDPLATGVLPIALGEATKTVAYALDASKCYRFTVAWGEERDTDDAAGRVSATSERRPAEPAIRAALGAFTGRIRQVPPAYSALKVAGERAYDLARRGEPAALAARAVEVASFELLELLGPERARFEVVCGKGTYVRALVRDLGRALGTAAHVAELRRTRVGPFTEAGAIGLDKLDQLGHIPAAERYLLPVETALADIPALALTEPQAIRLRRGQAVRVLNVEDGTVCAMQDGRAIAVAEVAEGEVRPVRVFNLVADGNSDVDYG